LRRFLILSVWLVLAARPALADVDLDTVTRTLSAQGFTRMEVSTTLLGRLRVVATSDDFVREIVFNASTGEILRDYWQKRSGRSGGQTTGLLNPGFGSDRAAGPRDGSNAGSSVPGVTTGSADNSGRSDDDGGEREDHDSPDRGDDD